VGPVLIVEVLELPERVQEVALVPDERCGCREPRPRHATRRYSLIMPSTRGCLRDTMLLKIDRFWWRFQRGSGAQQPVRPVVIVMGLVLAQDPPQMVHSR